MLYAGVPDAIILDWLDIVALGRLSRASTYWRSACAPYAAARQAALVACLPMAFVEMHVDGRDRIAAVLLTADDLALHTASRDVVRLYAVVRFVPDGACPPAVPQRSTASGTAASFARQTAALYEHHRNSAPLMKKSGTKLFAPRRWWHGSSDDNEKHGDAPIGWRLADMDAVAGVHVSDGGSFRHDDAASQWRRLLRTINVVCERIITDRTIPRPRREDVDRGERFVAQLGALFGECDAPFGALVQRRVRAQLAHDRRVFAV